MSTETCPGSDEPGGAFVLNGAHGVTCQVCARDFDDDGSGRPPLHESPPDSEDGFVHPPRRFEYPIGGLPSDPAAYEREHGPGSLQALIDRLRAS